jgi:hypothetical protein
MVRATWAWGSRGGSGAFVAGSRLLQAWRPGPGTPAAPRTCSAARLSGMSSGSGGPPSSAASAAAAAHCCCCCCCCCGSDAPGGASIVDGGSTTTRTAGTGAGAARSTPASVAACSGPLLSANACVRGGGKAGRVLGAAAAAGAAAGAAQLRRWPHRLPVGVLPAFPPRVREPPPQHTHTHLHQLVGALLYNSQVGQQVGLRQLAVAAHHLAHRRRVAPAGTRARVWDWLSVLPGRDDRSRAAATPARPGLTR